jgi:hypothetical protein
VLRAGVGTRARVDIDYVRSRGVGVADERHPLGGVIEDRDPLSLRVGYEG